jgi:OmpA-OmpF porin, OOP family
MTKILTLGIAGTLWSLAAFAAISSDMPGSRDHPRIPRVEGTVIVGYAHSDYDIGTFITGMEDRELQNATAEGERTRLMYLGKAGMSSLGILRNYQQALGALGSVTEKFSCRDNECYANFPTVWVWSSDNMLPNVFPDAKYLYKYSRELYRNQLYWYGTVQSGESLFHVSVFTSVRTAGGFKTHTDLLGEGQTLTHLEIVEVKDFEPTLAVVTAAEIGQEIGRSGRVALYGIHFDTDSDSLRDDSRPALAEIASALRADPGLSLYVVGHTDNQGNYEYNRALSERRALAVVAALRAEHGITADRLVPAGVGPVSPVASNNSEDGRALNRRVELVKR